MAVFDPEVGQQTLPMPERVTSNCLCSCRGEKGKVNQVKVTRQDSSASLHPVESYVARIRGIESLFLRRFFIFHHILYWSY